MQSKDEQIKYKSNLRNYQMNLDRYTKNLIEGCELIYNEISNKEDVNVENIPIVQRQLFHIKKNKNDKKIYVATNLLESMLENSYPTRGEANDIYNSLEMGASGLVLAAETAIGKHPKSSVIFLQKMIKAFGAKKIK